MFDRLKYVLRVNTSKELAYYIGVSESGISSAIKRDSIPYEYCTVIAISHGVPLDWLIYGDVDDGKLHYRSLNAEYFNRAYSNVEFDDHTLVKLNCAVQNCDDSHVELSTKEQMLLSGFKTLDKSNQNKLIQYLLSITDNDQVSESNNDGRQFSGDIGQYNAGDGRIDTQTFSKNK